MEIGIYTFGDLVPDPSTGRTATPLERIRQMLDMARLADEVGLDIIGVGEHHGPSFVNSATATTLSAMAAVTKRIRLTSAVTLLSTADPVRTFQEFATADLISNGRIEVIFGRGAFTESFPLFGYDLSDYESLFAEKLGLFELLNSQKQVSWSGRFRPSLKQANIAPQPAQERLPVWLGAGSQASIERAAKRDYPLAIPGLGGSVSALGNAATVYREARQQAGHPGPGRVAIYGHMHVGETSAQTRDDFYPYYAAYMEPIFRRPYTKQAFAGQLTPQGAFVGGDPNEVAEKILAIREATGAERYVGQIDVAGQPYSLVAKGIELLATKVVPQIRSALKS